MPAFITTAFTSSFTARPRTSPPYTARRPRLPARRSRPTATKSITHASADSPHAAPPPAAVDQVDHAATDSLLDSLKETPLPPPPSIIRQMVEHLADSRGLARLGLVDNFGRIGSPAVAELLHALQTSENPVIRRSAGKALAKIGDPRATAVLLDALVHDPDTVTRSSAAGALAKMGPSAVPSLLDLIADAEVPMTAKGHAAWAIAFMRGGDATAQALFDAAGSSNDDVRIAVVSALGAVAIGDSLPVMAGGEWDAEDEWEADGDVDVDPDTKTRAVATLRLMLDDGSAEVCAEAATALGNAGSVEDAAAIARLLDSSDGELRRCAALSLMKLGDASFAGVLREKAEDEAESEGVRRVARLAARSLEAAGERKAAGEREAEDWDR